MSGNKLVYIISIFDNILLIGVIIQVKKMFRISFLLMLMFYVFSGTAFSDNLEKSTCTDMERLYVVSTYPDNYQIQVPLAATIKINFNKNIFFGDAFKRITIYSEQGKKINIKCSISGASLIIKPTTKLALNNKYKVLVDFRAIKDKAGNVNDQYFFYFCSQENRLPIYINFGSYLYIGSNDKLIKVDTDIEVTSNENIYKSTNYNKIILTDNNNKAASFTASIEGKKLIIRPTANLKNSTKYTIKIPAGALQNKDNKLKNVSFSNQFTTIEERPPLPEPQGPVTATEYALPEIKVLSSISSFADHAVIKELSLGYFLDLRKIGETECDFKLVGPSSDRNPGYLYVYNKDYSKIFPALKQVLQVYYPANYKTILEKLKYATTKRKNIDRTTFDARTFEFTTFKDDADGIFIGN